MGGTSIFTGSGSATEGTVTAGGAGTSGAWGADAAGRVNHVPAGRPPPPPPPPRGPVPPPPPCTRAAPRHNIRIAIAACATNESAAAGACRRRGSGRLYEVKRGGVSGTAIHTQQTPTGGCYWPPA